MAKRAIDASEVEDTGILATGTAIHDWQYLNDKEGGLFLHS